ncbi:MAG: DivIVA domain-containing protein [Nitrospinota bacterium]
MRITPIDIRQQPFSVRLRGYDQQEVDAFLEMIANEQEKLAREIGRLNEELKVLRRENEGFRSTESEVKKVLLAAQTIKEEVSAKVEEISANARKQGELIVRDAQARANDMIESSKNTVCGVQEELSELLRRKKQLTRNIRTILETHLRSIEDEEKNDTSLNQELEARASAAADGPGGSSDLDNNLGRLSPLKVS